MTDQNKENTHFHNQERRGSQFLPSRMNSKIFVQKQGHFSSHSRAHLEHPEGVEDFPTPVILGVRLIFWVHISTLSKLLILVIGIFSTFVLHGYCQEWIFTNKQFKEVGWFLSGVQFLFYFLFASIEATLTKKREDIPSMLRQLEQEKHYRVNF